MDYLEVDGAKYSRSGRMWADKDGFTVSEIMQDRLNRLFLELRPFETMSCWELITAGDRSKETNSTGLAIRHYRAAFDKAEVREIEHILPRLTSCYRKTGKPQAAIDLLEEASKKYGRDVISPPLLTSAAAAYCDLGKYKLAKKACDRAYAMGGGEASPELRAVYGRIKKESPFLTDRKE